jgi:hypothetical protein
VPASDWEETVAAGARRDIFPDDVREAGGSSELVAWAGIAESLEISEEDGVPTETMRVLHRYFDWIEDFGLQRECFFLSPEGEGEFTAKWPLKKEWDLKLLQQQMRPGGMMVVYGRPELVDGDVVDLGTASYARYFPIEAYRTDKLDYGRAASSSLTR